MSAMARRVAKAAALIVTGAMAPLASVSAQTPDRWQFQATVYGYFPTMAGATTFPPADATADFSVDVDKILDNLQFTFMGSFEARKDSWGGFTDIIYLDIGNSKSGSRDLSIGNAGLPAGANADLNFDLKGAVWTLAGTYRAIERPAYTLDVLLGVRMLDISQTLQWQLTGTIGSIPLPSRAGSREARLQNWDAIVGLKGRAAFGTKQRWFVPYNFDVGTGSSEFTWQAVAGLGYSFRWGGVVAAWRYLDYKMNDKAIEELSFSGPGIAAVFRW